MKSTLEIKDLHASIDGKQILKGVDLRIKQGEIHAVMGPNGTGKSTLAYVLMGHPKYTVDRGEILFNGQNILALKPDERARLGLFLAFQYPMEIQGVAFSQFLLSAARSQRQTDAQSASGNPNSSDSSFSLVDFRKQLEEKARMLGLDKSFVNRALNVGFSGGEKKRAEILQMAVLQPKIAILDETDSGLDIDSLKIVANAVNNMRGEGFGALVITHYQRLLEHLAPDFVHIFLDGRIAKTGDSRLARDLEKKGYVGIMKELGFEAGLSVINH